MAITPTSSSAQTIAALTQQQAEIRELAQRDREVRSHEQAHASVGGQYASTPQFELTRGPNGVSYATSGHVDIDLSPVPGDPEATLEKSLTVQRAALAPANPSAQDRAVAAQASAQAAQARAEILNSRLDPEAEDGTTSSPLGNLVDVVA